MLRKSIIQTRRSPQNSPYTSSASVAQAPIAAKSTVVSCRLNDRTVDALDTLVEAGIRPTRSDAAAWLIGIGLEANQALLERVYATVAEIRRLRQEAQSMAQQDVDPQP